MRVTTVLGLAALLAGGAALAFEEGKAPVPPPVPAARRRGVSPEAKEAFARIDKAVYCPLRNGTTDLTGIILIEGRDKKANDTETRYTVKARAPDDIRITSTILTDVKGLEPKAIAELKPRLAKTERSMAFLMRRFMGTFRPPPGMKHDAATEALPDGGMLLVVTLYEEGKPAEREFLTLDAEGLPILLETATAEVESPPSRIPGGGAADPPQPGKGAKAATPPAVKTWKLAWEKGEQGSRLIGYELRSTDSTTVGECTLRWIPHGDRQYFGMWSMKNGGRILFKEMKVGGKSVDLAPLDKETPEAPK